MATDTEAAPEVTQQTPETTPETTPEATAQPEKKEFDPSAIPDEIKTYFAKQHEAELKKYADYDRHVAAAREWESVRNDPRFQQWSQSLNQPQAPKPFEIDDDRFTKALTDRNEFTKLVQEAAQHLVDSRYAPQIQQTQHQQKVAEKMTDLNNTVAKYPDFKELDSRGLIEPLVMKYPNVSFEDIYWMAKKNTFNEEVDKRARGLVEKKKTATVERGSGAPSARGSKIAVKSRLEAMELAAEAFRAGRPMPEFEFSDSGE